ncbi:rhodanese-related sulfurtransferase [Arthrobacter oryzae]|jgi:rhodanese-related sulfurtransferase|nr:rhodanese-related sulfurtransferase [Arthrobacter oryzae]
MAEITIAEAEQRRSAARILDVREDFEVEEGKIPGALHIPMGQLQARLSELGPTVPVVVVCRSATVQPASPTPSTVPAMRRTPWPAA